MVTSRYWRWLVGAVGGAVLLLAVAAEVFRWVDDKGGIHYGSSPPPGVKATRIDAPPPLSAEAASAARASAQQTIERAQRLAAERERPDAQRGLEEALARRDSKTRIQRCAQAREQLATVERGGPVYHVDERGQRVWLDDALRDGEIARLRAAVATQCDGGDPAQEAVTRQETDAALRRAQCDKARRTVSDLEQPGSRAPAWEIAQARERVQRLCDPAR